MRQGQNSLDKIKRKSSNGALNKQINNATDRELISKVYDLVKNVHVGHFISNFPQTTVKSEEIALPEIFNNLKTV